MSQPGVWCSSTHESPRPLQPTSSGQPGVVTESESTASSLSLLSHSLSTFNCLGKACLRVGRVCLPPDLVEVHCLFQWACVFSAEKWCVPTSLISMSNDLITLCQVSSTLSNLVDLQLTFEWLPFTSSRSLGLQLLLTVGRFEICFSLTSWTFCLKVGILQATVILLLVLKCIVQWLLICQIVLVNIVLVGYTLFFLRRATNFMFFHFSIDLCEKLVDYTE